MAITSQVRYVCDLCVTDAIVSEPAERDGKWLAAAPPGWATITVNGSIDKHLCQSCARAVAGTVAMRKGKS